MDDQNHPLPLETYWYQTAAKLAIKFKKDYLESSQCFPPDKKIDLYEHLLKCLELAEINLSDPTDHTWKNYLDLESSFRKKQGSRLKVYVNKNMAIYYGDELAFLKKGVFTADEWKLLPEEKREIPHQQMLFFINLCKGMLRCEQENIWLEQSPDDLTTEILNHQSPLDVTAIKAAEQAENKRRKALDKATTLSQEQSVLLLHYLKEIKVFLREHNLNNKDAGIAFGILTGYSHDTIRQKLGKIEPLQTYENLEFLYNYTVRLQNAIELDLNKLEKPE